MSTTLEYLTALSLVTCSECGIAFGIPENYEHKRRNDHNAFYCPNGHSQHYPQQSEAERERARAQRLERTLANREEDLRAERASHRATKGQLTKVRKQVERVEKGVCPHCNRHFVNVERHMVNKHSEATA